MILGVTGGVGGGKSTVLKLLEDNYNAALIIADEVGHELLLPGRENYRRVVRTFGRKVLAADGQIDRRKLAEMVFPDAEKTALLNSLTHPVIREEILKRIALLQKEDSRRLIVIEAALLSEGKLAELCGSVWYVYCDEETRIRRIMSSRGYSREKSESVVRRQKTDAEFRAECTLVIDNSGTQEHTKEQVDAAMEELLRSSI